MAAANKAARSVRLPRIQYACHALASDVVCTRVDTLLDGSQQDADNNTAIQEQLLVKSAE